MEGRITTEMQQKKKSLSAGFFHLHQPQRQAKREEEFKLQPASCTVLNLPGHLLPLNSAEGAVTKAYCSTHSTD